MIIKMVRYMVMLRVRDMVRCGIRVKDEVNYWVMAELELGI